MYTLLRSLLILVVLTTVYAVGGMVYLIPEVRLPLGLFGLFLLARKGRYLYAHGTARWARAPVDVPHLIDGGDGLIVGHLKGKPPVAYGLRALLHTKVPAAFAARRFLEACQNKPTRYQVRLNSSIHTCVFAPTGGGKSASCVLPFLLTNRDSCVVVDFKGELAQKTLEARRRMGHTCVLLDPYQRVTQQPDTFNPFDFIDPDSELAIDDCRDIAEALVVRTGQEKDPFWNDAAETWLTAMSALLVHLKPDAAANLAALKTLVSETPLMQQAIVKMTASDAWDGVLSRLGHALTHSKDKELNSTLTSTNRHLRFVDSPAIAASTEASSFDPAQLLTGKMTIYLILPPDRMRSQSGLLRLWVGSLFRAIIRGGDLQETRKINFILDEAASLGRMEAVDDAIDKYRGYGIRLFLYYQSLGQLKKCFPDDQGQTLLSNTTQVFFGVNDQQTAEYVSNRLGEQTIIVSSGGTSSGSSQSHDSKAGTSSTSTSRNRNDNWQQQGRKLLRPEEVCGLPKWDAITFCPGAPPLWTKLMHYEDRYLLKSRGIGPVKAVVDATCLFLTASLLAVMVTWGLMFGFSETSHVAAFQGFPRASEVGREPDLASSLKEVGGQLWDAAKPMFDHGRTELAAALFAGHAHVMYMHGQNEGVEQAQHQNPEPPEVQQDMGREL